MLYMISMNMSLREEEAQSTISKGINHLQHTGYRIHVQYTSCEYI